MEHKDYIKIQTEALKNINSKDPGNQIRFHRYETEGRKYVIALSGYWLHFIPEEEFYLNDAKCVAVDSIDGLINAFKDDLNKSVRAEVTDDMKNVAKGIVVKLKAVDGDQTVWVNQKYLKSFGKRVGFFISEEKKPVFVYDESVEHLHGLILPVRVKQEA